MVFAHSTCEHHSDQIRWQHGFASRPQRQSPMAKRRNKRYLASSSDTRPPYLRKNHGVRNGKIAKTATHTTTKIRVLNVNGEKMRPSAMTVPRSFTKQLARMAFPYS